MFIYLIQHCKFEAVVSYEGHYVDEVCFFYRRSAKSLLMNLLENGEGISSVRNRQLHRLVSLLTSVLINTLKNKL